MKKLIITGLIAAALSGAAFAAETSSDLILGFRAFQGTGSGNNLQIDLGSADSIVAAANSAGGTATLGNLVTGATFGNTGANTIDTIYGSSWNTRSDVLWAVVGSTTSGSDPLGYAKSTLWGSSIANGSASSPWTPNTASSQNAGTSKIGVLYANMTGTFQNKLTSVTGAWSKQELPGSGSLGFGWFNPYTTQLENTTNITGSYVSSDLYSISPTDTGTGLATLLGTIDITGTGAVTFTLAPIPEPSTYAMILGVFALGFVMLRRRQQVTA